MITNTYIHITLLKYIIDAKKKNKKKYMQKYKKLSQNKQCFEFEREWSKFHHIEIRRK